MAALSRMSLGPGAFDAFLYAPVGEDTAGTSLTVLSALARLGLDPWDEASRLANLPRGAAIQALAKNVARLPLGNWQESDSPDIATRLIDYLPAAGTPPVAASGLGPKQDVVTQLLGKLKLPALPGLKSRRVRWAILALLGLGWFYFLSVYEAKPPFEAPTKSIQQ